MKRPSEDTPGLRVVFLDDEAGIRLALVRTAAMLGVRAIPVASRAALRAELAWCGADAAILDFRLGDGTTCAELVRELRAAGFPVVIWTGDVEGATATLEELAPVVPKSANVGALFDAIVRVIDRGSPTSPGGARCL